MPNNAETVAAILDRKRSGIDCTEEESATLKCWLDRYTTELAAESDPIAELFPLEFAEWCDDFENEKRPQHNDGGADAG